MHPEIHGHEVMERMQASGLQFTRASLATFIVDQFGPTARFHTCSADGMTAGELVEFLAARGKFLGTEEAFGLNPHRVCGH